MVLVRVRPRHDWAPSSSEGGARFVVSGDVRNRPGKPGGVVGGALHAVVTGRLNAPYTPPATPNENAAMTKPTVTLHGGITFEPGHGVLRCPTCCADTGHQVRGILGDPVTITCRDGHAIALPEGVHPTDFLMQLASEPGVGLLLPEEWSSGGADA